VAETRTATPRHPCLHRSTFTLVRIRKAALVANRFVTAGNSPLGSEWTFRKVCNRNPLKLRNVGTNSAIANQVRLVFHTAAYWLMHRVRAAIPPAHPLARAEFATIRERLIKIAARVIEHVARIRIQLPTSCPEGALFRTVALGLMQSGP
jgi:hypothetical protein